MTTPNPESLDFQTCNEMMLTIIGVAKTWIYGNVIAGIIYGAIVLVGIAYFRIIAIQIIGKRMLSKQQWILSVYVMIAFILSTLQVTGSLQKTTELLSVTCSNAINVYEISRPSGTWLEIICFMLTSWLVDVIMMWRFLAVYHDFKWMKWSIFVFSSVLQITSIGLGIHSSCVIAGLFQTTFLLGNMNYVVAIFEILTLIQNMMLTTLIVGRLLLVRSQIQKAFGRSYGKEYISVATMLVESQAHLCISQVILLATSLMSDYIKYGFTFFQIVGQLQVLAPMMLIYRVMQGKVYNSQKLNNSHISSLTMNLRRKPNLQL
ncbi:hypothetical protein BDQ17DRAFT_1380762, partial [Cyathus striatus]